VGVQNPVASNNWLPFAFVFPNPIFFSFLPVPSSPYPSLPLKLASLVIMYIETTWENRKYLEGYFFHQENCSNYDELFKNK
jgi:hypothetical protein